MGEAMNDETKNLSDENAQRAAEWFAALKPFRTGFPMTHTSKMWQSVVETDRVPKTFVNIHLMRMPLAGGGDEPIGDRIIELPQDIARAESRDPHSGFIAYVPKGSLAKGMEFVNTGGGGKTIQCRICHGSRLNGLGEVPAIAGHSPLYLFRQLYYFAHSTDVSGSRHGSMAALMRGVVAQMSQDDMLAIAAYVGSLEPDYQETVLSAPQPSSVTIEPSDQKPAR
jgi:cytochrome c553